MTTPVRSPAVYRTRSSPRATGGHGQAAGGLRDDVTQFGYQEKEYFFDGTAKTYPPAALPPAPYRSRMIVWTPMDPSRFNGTTVVEWAEVSDFGQFELTVELNYESPMLEKQGFAFVLVSAEKRGVCDQSSNGCTATSLKGADPERYGSLEHPGDAYSFDIFSQALQAIKHPTGLAPLGKLQTHTVIAEGFQRSVDKYFPVGAPRLHFPALSVQHLRAAQRLPRQRGGQRRPPGGRLPHRRRRTRRRAGSLPRTHPASPGRVRHTPDPDAGPPEPRHLGDHRRAAR